MRPGEVRGVSKRKKPLTVSSKGFRVKKRHRPTLPPVTAIPSALAGLTALFGMGRGRHRRYRHLKIFIGLSYDNISSSGQLTYILKELRFFLLFFSFLKIKEEDNSLICLRKLRAISTTWLWSLNLYTYGLST